MALHATVRTADERRIVVKATFTHHDPRAGKTDIHHEPVTEPYTVVSFQGDVYEKEGREPVAIGQVYGDLPKDHPLRLLWECTGGPRPNALFGPDGRSAESGYRCGSAWLVEPLPDDVRRQIVALMTTDITTKGISMHPDMCRTSRPMVEERAASDCEDALDKAKTETLAALTALLRSDELSAVQEAVTHLHRALESASQAAALTVVLTV